jgi:hypothetical protein
MNNLVFTIGWIEDSLSKLSNKILHFQPLNHSKKTNYRNNFFTLAKNISSHEKPFSNSKQTYKKFGF